MEPLLSLQGGAYARGEAILVSCLWNVAGPHLSVASQVFCPNNRGLIRHWKTWGIFAVELILSWQVCVCTDHWLLFIECASLVPSEARTRGAPKLRTFMPSAHSRVPTRLPSGVVDVEECGDARSFNSMLTELSHIGVIIARPVARCTDRQSGI